MSEDLSGFSLMELFREEVETHSAVLNDGLLALENGDPDFEPLMRAAHSLKGAARIVDLEVVVRVAHAMEDCFVAAQEGKLTSLPQNAQVLFRAVDFIVAVAGMDEVEVTRYLVNQAETIESLIFDLGDLASPTSQPPRAPKGEGKDQSRVAPVSTENQDQDEGARAESIQENSESSKSSAPPTRATENRDLRIRAENLTRLMGLAGEAVVAAGWLEQLTDSLASLEVNHKKLDRRLDALSKPSRSSAEFAELLHETKTQLDSCVAGLADRRQAFDRYSRRSVELSSRLYREVLSGRMRPFSDGTKAFPRMVRDLAQELGKMVRLEIRGHDTEVDRDILERLEAPLNHLLRNALDHGTELPDSRRNKGKDPTARILLEARHQGGKLLITVQDDGRGIDLEDLRGQIVERNAATSDRVEAMESEELYSFLFLPGFSTLESVSEISGRGVGLDVVQSMVQEVGGTVRVQCPEGAGTSFILELPVTRSVLRVLLVEMAGQPFAIPMARVDRVLSLARSQILVLEARQYFDLDGENIGLVAARQVLGLDSSSTDRDRLPVVVVGNRDEIYGLVVDRFLGEREVVVQPLDPRLGAVRDIAASALMDDGSPVLILDVDDIMYSVAALLQDTELVAVGSAERRSLKRILIADDSPTMREAERVCLERAGYAVAAAVDGHDAWNSLRAEPFDLLISDVDMPRLTGLELVRRVRSEERWSELPILMLSHRDSDEDRQRGLDAGADHYLSKSDGLEESLLVAVRSLIGKPSE